MFLKQNKLIPFLFRREEKEKSFQKIQKKEKENIIERTFMEINFIFY